MIVHFDSPLYASYLRGRIVAEDWESQTLSHGEDGLVRTGSDANEMVIGNVDFHFGSNTPSSDPILASSL